jgi:NAD(P)-dependent dehydrogenase (short-subunit alcohol dehydrogenase family)
MKDVAGKVAFITGGASGIGLGIAKVFAGAGMKVVIADLRQDHIDAAMEYFSGNGKAEDVHAIRLDVTDRDAMERAAEQTEEVFGKVHVLVNNAGVGIEGPLDKATYADWDFGIGVNLGGVINGIQAFLPRIRAHGEGGHIVNTASLAALVVMPAYMAMYVTSKAAVIALSEALSTELPQENIGVTVLCPGPVKSNIHELGRNRPQKFKQDSGFAEAEQNLGQRPVSDMWMEPEEVGNMILDAIVNDKLYVITHGEWREMAAARFDAMLEAMPTEVNPELIATLRKHREEG